MRRALLSLLVCVGSSLFAGRFSGGPFELNDPKGCEKGATLSVSTRPLQKFPIDDKCSADKLFYLRHYDDAGGEPYSLVCLKTDKGRLIRVANDYRVSFSASPDCQWLFVDGRENASVYQAKDGQKFLLPGVRPGAEWRGSPLALYSLERNDKKSRITLRRWGGPGNESVVIERTDLDDCANEAGEGPASGIVYEKDGTAVLEYPTSQKPKDNPLLLEQLKNFAGLKPGRRVRFQLSTGKVISDESVAIFCYPG